jgi:YjbE family integral membrane protein
VEINNAMLLALLQIVWINILLSGDNAIAIGLACRNLSPRHRRLGILYGTAVAVLLRIIFALAIVWLLKIPFLKAVGGMALLWIAISLARGGDQDHKVAASEMLWRAVLTIVVADATMSLDNVLGIAAVAKDNITLFIVGLLISMPLVMIGATAFTRVLDRFPIIVWAGAALLGWVAGELIVEDQSAMAALGQQPTQMQQYVVAAACAALVVMMAWWLMRRAADRAVQR